MEIEPKPRHRVTKKRLLFVGGAFVLVMLAALGGWFVSEWRRVPELSPEETAIVQAVESFISSRHAKLISIEIVGSSRSSRAIARCESTHSTTLLNRKRVNLLVSKPGPGTEWFVFDVYFPDSKPSPTDDSPAPLG